MRKLFLIGIFLMLAGSGWARADMASEFSSSSRYQMFANPHANRVYVLDTQTGRVFQLVNYKDVGKEIMEEVPYIYGSAHLCSPSEYERSNDKCFNRNYDYIKTLMDLTHEATTKPTPPPPSPAKPVETKP